MKSWYGTAEIRARIQKDSFRRFVRREWKSAFTFSLAGAFTGVSLHVLISDAGVRSFLEVFLSSHNLSVTRALPYSRDFLTLAFIGIVVAAGFSSSLVRRVLRSWLVGCISGIPLWCGIWTLILFLQPYGITLTSLGFCIAAIVAFLVVSFVIHLNALARRLHPPDPMELRVRASERRAQRNWNHIGDEPIRSWEQDILSRAPIVDIITNKALIGGASVIALSGPLGIGKSSVLNLLQTHLEHKGIVVRFVTWLPGSQYVLSSYLLADIATECEKK